jgi:phage gp45-like
MNRNSLSEMSGRIMHMAARFTLNSTTDTSMMQEMVFDAMNSEGRKAVERIQSFGFSSVPLPRDKDDDKGGQQQQGDSEQPKGPAAEGIALFLGGQRNHPVVIGVDDRRHRPMGMKPGENAQYDDQGQMTLLRRGGLFMVSLDDNGSGTAPGGTMLRDAEGRATGQSEKKERMVSMRHVEKQKEKRDPVGKAYKGQPKTPQQRAEDAQAREQYKHEGDTVNTEVRCTKNRISFYSGTDEVGFYDKQSKTWHLKGDTIILEGTVKLGSPNASKKVHRIGDTDSDGDTAVTGADKVLA